MTEPSDKELLDALGVEVKPKKKVKLTKQQERVIAGFEEIQRFVQDHGHAPRYGEDKDIFERIYATRLDRIKKLPDCNELMKDMDHQGILNGEVATEIAEDCSDEALLAELGAQSSHSEDITKLKHVKSKAQKAREKADEIGVRAACEDFELFKPMFEAAQNDLNTGLRITLPFIKNGSIEKGNLFILGGQKAFVASIGSEFIGKDGRKEYRLRVIFDNGVESNQLMRSLQKRLWEDETGRRISEVDAGPIFDENIAEDDSASGTIYVLRSLLDHPAVNENRGVIHKIGVTGGDVSKRIANAKKDPTYLMAGVEVVATYELFNINRNKLEGLIHRFFSHAKLEIKVMDRFGNPVIPQEWFLVPLFVIDEMVERIKDGTISNYQYDVETAQLIPS